ncbi:MAG: 3D domain-containing protein [Candidatus Eremiobacteraeota bacterium]|nr:3D domain-containing protein [Candidatus Eremiobacteraeota bacterium]
MTTAVTVGEFLRERGIVVAERDYVAPALDVPLSDRLTVVYRAAVPVSILSSHGKLDVISNAENVGALLEEENIHTGPHDVIAPAIDETVPANGTVRIAHVVTWNRTEKHLIGQSIQHRLDFSIPPGTTKIIAKGSPGEREIMVRFTQRDNERFSKAVVSSRIVKKPKPRIVAEGVDEYEAFARRAHGGIVQTAYVAASALDMVATAYTAGCYGCSGITATGRPAGHGVVAVDPGVIPLGTRLYIRGYGFAVAGDTGGAIRGRRIDLGFNSMRDAMLFGRREVVVYRLK